MPERLTRLVPPFDSPEARAVHAAITGGPRSTGPQHVPLTEADGSLAGPFGVMLHAPSVGAPLQALGSAVRYETSLDDRVRETAVLTVAAVLGSDFEWRSHEPVARAAGLDDAGLAAIRSEAGDNPVSRLVRRLVLEEDLDDDAYAAARELLGEEALVELVVLVGYYRTLALMLRVFRVDPGPEGADAPSP